MRCREMAYQPAEPHIQLNKGSHVLYSMSLLSFSIRGQTENHNHRKLTSLIIWTTALSNSMKLWAMLCRAIQDRWVMVESSDKMWSTGEGNGKPLQYSWEPHEHYEKAKRQDTERWTPQVVGAQYATGDQRRNNSKKNEGKEPKQKQHPVVDVTGDRGKMMLQRAILA